MSLMRGMWQRECGREQPMWASRAGQSDQGREDKKWEGSTDVSRSDSRGQGSTYAHGGGSPHTGAQPGSSPWPTSPQTRSCSRCLEQKASGARGKIPAHPKAPALPEAIPGPVSMDSVLQEGHKGDIFLCSHQPAWTVFYSSRTSDPASRRQGRLWPDTPIPMALPPSVLNTNP